MYGRTMLRLVPLTHQTGMHAMLHDIHGYTNGKAYSSANCNARIVSGDGLNEPGRIP